MTQKEFNQKAMDSIKDYLPEEYQSHIVEIQEVNRAGRRYDGLVVRSSSGGTQASPILNLNNAFRKYEEGATFEDIMKELADIRMSANIDQTGFTKEMIADFEQAKSKLVMRLINTEANSDYLRNKRKASIEMEDLSIIFAVRIVHDDGVGDAVVTDDLLDCWGVSLEEVYEQAIQNCESAQVKFTNIVSELFNLPKCDIEDIELDAYPVPLFILTNPQSTKGAGAVLNPFVMKRIVDKFGEDLRVIPSSTEEVMILPNDDEGPSIEELAAMVASINETNVAPEDRLSDNIYKYDMDTNRLVLANK